MMRKLKFRVWSESDKEYRTDCRLTELFTSITGSPATVYSDEGDTFIIEQYTGLKDKNGKEIYEGDIVRFGIAGNESRGFVEYSDDFGSYEVLTKKGFIIQTLFAARGEVIGNIHENGELLGGEE